jgi:hypothetical protein
MIKNIFGLISIWVGLTIIPLFMYLVLQNNINALNVVLLLPIMVMLSVGLCLYGAYLLGHHLLQY